MSLGKVLLTGALVTGALWAAKRLVGALIGLFSRSGDDDSPNLSQPYSGASQERRPLHDDSRGYYGYPDPHVVPSYQQPTLVGPRLHQAPAVYPVQLGQGRLFDFLPVRNRRDYEAARAEVGRLQRLEEKYLAKKKLATRRGDNYHTNHYEQLIQSQRGTMDILNAEASAWIYQENNRPGRLSANSVDLHGLRVVEAVEYAEIAVQDAENRGKQKVRLIVGKGKHSEGGVSKLKPAISNALKSRGRLVKVDPHNAGVLVVYLGDRHFNSDMV